MVVIWYFSIVGEIERLKSERSFKFTNRLYYLTIMIDLAKGRFTSYPIYSWNDHVVGLLSVLCSIFFLPVFRFLYIYKPIGFLLSKYDISAYLPFTCVFIGSGKQNKAQPFNVKYYDTSSSFRACSGNSAVDIVDNTHFENTIVLFNITLRAWAVRLFTEQYKYDRGV